MCQAHCQAIMEKQPWMRQMISASRSVWSVLRDLHSKAIMQIIIYSKCEYIMQERGRFLWACGWEDALARGACVREHMCAWSKQLHLVHVKGGEWGCQLAPWCWGRAWKKSEGISAKMRVLAGPCGHGCQQQTASWDFNIYSKKSQLNIHTLKKKKTLY